MAVPLAQLSCKQCQQRKTKCSKTVPCSACVRSEITCTAVQRHRLPRGRSRVQKRDGTSMQAIVDRVARLETIITQAHPNNIQPQSLPNLTSAAADSYHASTLHSVESFVASDFWLQLSDAVTGLRGVLEQHDEVETALDGQESCLTESGISTDPQSILFPSSSAQTYNLDALSPETREWLLVIYKDRVDAMFKTLHWPSALSAIHSQTLNMSLEARCLECAMLFTATCALLDFERERQQISREEFRMATEAALIQADLLTTTSIVVLQAFVVYLAGLRTVRAAAQQWTLIATAIRIANAQGIPTHFQPFFAGEIQRRVWHCIGVLDLQSAFDRGSQPLIRPADLNPLPLDINDVEISSTIMPSSERTQGTRHTEMSLSLTIFKAGICQRRLTEIGMSVCLPDAQGDPLVAGCEQLAVLEEFARHEEQLTEICNNSPSPLRRFTVAVANESIVAMRLQLHRPLYRQPSNLAPVHVGSLADLDVLTTATEVLERSQTKRNQLEFAPWAWFSWVKWYALAVVLVELCTAPGPGSDRAWTVAQLAFDDYAKAVADEQFGLLWKPIVNLMRRAKAGQSQDRAAAELSRTSFILRQQDQGWNPAVTTSSSVSSLVANDWEGSTAEMFGHMDANDLGNDNASLDFHWNLLIDNLNEFDTDNIWSYAAEDEYAILQ